MHIFLKLMGGISILLLVCTLICGLWIRVHPSGDVRFHATLSITAVVVALITIVLFLFQK
jgi:hypothetical protein